MLKKIKLEDLSKIKPFSANPDHDAIHRYNYSKLVKKCIQELQGISAAIIYDGKIDDSEIDLIQNWLLKHDEYLIEYPLSDLKKLFNEIIEDNVITNKEKEKLLKFLSNISASPESNPTVDFQKIQKLNSLKRIFSSLVI